MGKLKGNSKLQLRHRTAIVDDYSSSSSRKQIQKGRPPKTLRPSTPPTAVKLGVEKDEIKHNDINSKLETESEIGNNRKKRDQKDRKPSSAGLPLTCSYCPYECPKSRNFDMKRHLVRLHPEMFFKSERNSSSLSPWKAEHFQEILMDIVFPEFVFNNEAYPSSSSWCLCSICGEKYSKVKRCLQLRIHLIDDHIQEVRESFKDILEEDEATLKEKLENNVLPFKKRVKSSTSSKLKNGQGQPFCEFCNKSFSCSSSAERHRKYYCPKGERLPQSTFDSVQTCVYCSHECPNRSDYMKRHMLRCHPEVFFQYEKNSSLSQSQWKKSHFKGILTEIAIPKFISRNGSSASCSICEKKYTDKRFKNNRYELIRHLVHNHNDEVREYLKDLLGKSDKYLQEQLNKDALAQKSASDFSDSDDEEDENDEMDDENLVDMDVDENCVKDSMTLPPSRHRSFTDELRIRILCLIVASDMRSCFPKLQTGHEI